jgi:hypothetical protein
MGRGKELYRVPVDQGMTARMIVNQEDVRKKEVQKTGAFSVVFV